MHEPPQIVLIMALTCPSNSLITFMVFMLFHSLIFLGTPLDGAVTPAVKFV